jgi:NTE family protein
MPVELPLVSNPEPESVEDTRAVCLSGGGYRAMLFHVGTLWYLNDSGHLEKIDRISSVSGGSITAGVLALNWASLTAGKFSAASFQQYVVTPVRRMASKTVDEPSIIAGIFLPGTISDRVTDYYKKELFGEKTLQDLPDRPRFVINSTNVQTGSLFRFSKPYIADYRIGRCLNPHTLVAQAVAASSAFPPVLSPARIEFKEGDFSTDAGELNHPPFNTDVVLTDGGVYDNMGIETAWKRCRTIFVSDGGGKMQPEGDPHSDWARHALRINDLIDNQVRSLRKRQIVEAFKAKERLGAYWGMWTDPGEYPAPSQLSLPADSAMGLAKTPTRLKSMPDDLQERIINFGYGMAERAIRSFYDPASKAATAFPYPRGI